MKKNILLFAMMMAICGGAFGQKEPKLLWERVIQVTGFGGASQNALASPNGNIGAGTLSGGIGYFDKNGNKIGLSNLKTPLDKNTYPILDKNFEIVGTIDLSKTRQGSYLLHEEEDGLLAVNLDNDKTVKYDLNGKEVWRYNYNHESKINLQLQYKLLKDFYGLLEQGPRESKIFILSKKGVKTGAISLDYTPGSVFSSNDKSIWISERDKYNRSIEFTKYDSTGTKIQVIKPQINNYQDAFIFSPQNSVVMSSISEDLKQIFFTRTDTKGNVKVVSMKIDEFKSFIQYNRLSNYYIKMEMIDENRFRFFINSGNLSLMGFGSFEDANSGWIREAKNPNFAKNTFITYTNGNITSFNIDGSVKWTFLFSGTEYPLLNEDSSINIQDFLYVQNVKDGQNYVSKLGIDDGKIIWEQIINKGEVVSDIKQDSEKNDYLVYRSSLSLVSTYRIIKISKITQKVSKYYESPALDHGGRGCFVIDVKNKILLTFPLEFNNQTGIGTFILRKYSTRCVYDLEAEALGNTEVCSGSKVKLSTTKQDGLTYQWQKDGKDIPTFKDVVHDVEESGTYTVTVKDEICQSQTTSNAIKVTIKPLPIATISTETKGVLYEPFTVKLSANTGTGLAYQWLKDDALIPNETIAFYEAKKTGKYAVKVTKDGCVKTSEPLLISILVPLANSEEVGEETVQVYPNPSNGNFKIILPKSLKGSDIQLLDSFGRQRSLVYVGEQAQAEGLVQGVYFLKVSKGEKVVTNKILIE